MNAALLVLGMAPGLKGANRTGRPFTGDYAGDLLYTVLLEQGLATGRYGQSPDDGLILQNCRVTNAVRCVPPQNKPTPEEARTCARFLIGTLQEMPNLKAVLALGKIAHDAYLRATGEKLSRYPFGHGSHHALGGVALVSSYHCSRYNTQTGRLTHAMFSEAVQAAKTAAGLS